MNANIRLKCLLAVLVPVLFVPCARADDAPTTLTVVHWNVENLFDADDDPENDGDDEFLPHTFKLWTTERYQRKLDHLSEILIPLKADFIAVAEVENRRVLEDLAERVGAGTGFRYPHIIHRDGPEKRGIDVAIIARYAATGTNWVNAVPGQRESMFADFKVNGAALTLSVNHWKSHIGLAHETLAIRMKEAESVRAAVNRRLTADPAAAIVVLGDFNDDYESATLIMGLKSLTDRKTVLADRGAKYLYNLHDTLQRGRDGTYYYTYGFTWNTYDSMSVSAGMLDEADRDASGWQVLPDSYRIYKPDKSKDERGRPNPFRRTRDWDTKELVYLEGYSDHFPVVVTLKRRD